MGAIFALSFSLSIKYTEGYKLRRVTYEYYGAITLLCECVRVFGKNFVTELPQVSFIVDVMQI